MIPRLGREPLSNWVAAWPYALLLACALAIGIGSMEILSGVRAYVGGEGLYSKAQKDAVAHLARYIQSRSEADLAAYRAAIAVPLGDRAARVALSLPKPDLAAARAGFVLGRNDPADIDRMIWLFRWGGWFGPMRRCIEIWTEGDARIAQINAIAQRLGGGAQAPAAGPDDARTVDELRRIDAALAPLEDNFSAILGQCARQVQRILDGLLVVFVLGMSLLVTAVHRTRRREGEKIRVLLRNASDGIHVLDRQGRLLEASESFCRMLGYGREELIGKHVSQWDAGLPGDLLEQKLSEQFASPGRIQFESRHRRKDGTLFDVEVSGMPVELDGGAVLFNSSRDVSGRKANEAAQRESERRLRAVIEQSPIGMSFARHGIILDCNEVYVRMFGYADAEEIRGQAVLSHVAPEFRAQMEERIRRRERGEWAEQTYETVGLRKDGSRFPIYISAKSLEFKDGPLTIAFLIDVTRQKMSEDEIRRLAFYDHLTELPNRRLLQDRLLHTAATCARTGRHGALLFIDLDEFKLLNDTLGHAAGDELLKMASARLKSCVREDDTIARMGGDEFIVVLGGLSATMIDAAQQAEAISEKILSAFHPPFRLAAQEYHCTASVGATLFTGTEAPQVDLVQQADIAMYQAKKAGRNCIRFFDPQMQVAISAQAALEADLRQALDRGQFELHYQVQVDRRGRTFGAEALIRWRHPERGAVPPAQFIPLAERTDLILPIGQWVLEQACAQLRAWSRDPERRRLTLCVNVSARQFHRPEFADAVREAVARHGIDPARLTLELTESHLLDDAEGTIVTMNALKDTGLRFSLDDFGTGYSSLQYLKRLPLHQLKIDQSFVRDIVADRNDLAIVQTIIAMARSLNLAVIAEGVETEEQLRLLREHGCGEFQGYLFGRPVPIEAFDAALAVLGVAA